MKIKPQTEKEITRSIRSYLQALRIFHWKVWQGLGSQKGVSDIIGIYKGKFVAIEVKREDRLDCPYNCTHKTCKEQKLFLFDVSDAGGIAIVARSVGDVFGGLGIGSYGKRDR